MHLGIGTASVMIGDLLPYHTNMHPLSKTEKWCRYAEFGDELALEHHEHPPKSTAGVQGSSMAIFVSKVWKSRKAGRIVGMMGDKTSMYPVTPSIREAFTDVKEFNFETPSPDAVNIAAQERESPKNVGCVTKNMKNMAPISNTLEGSIS